MLGVFGKLQVAEMVGAGEVGMGSIMKTSSTRLRARLSLTAGRGHGGFQAGE